MGNEKGDYKIKITTKELAEMTGISLGMISHSTRNLVKNNVIFLLNTPNKNCCGIYEINKNISEWGTEKMQFKIPKKPNIHEVLFVHFFKDKKIKTSEEEFINLEIVNGDDKLLRNIIEYILEIVFKVHGAKLRNYTSQFANLLTHLINLDEYDFNIIKDIKILFYYVDLQNQQKDMNKLVLNWCAFVQHRPEILSANDTRKKLSNFIKKKWNL